MSTMRSFKKPKNGYMNREREAELIERCPVCGTPILCKNPKQGVKAHVFHSADDAHDVELNDDLEILGDVSPVTPKTTDW